MLKTCNTCKIEQDTSNFYKSKKDGLMYSCKSCSRKNKDEWNKNNPEKTKIQNRKSDKVRSIKIKEDPIRYRKYREIQVKNKYGISMEDYDKMFLSQNSVCAICKSSTINALCVDHNHETGQIRGLLCHRCNLVIGNAKENINTLLETITYLQKYKI